MQKLAEDEKNRVYTYVHDQPTVTYTAQQQKRLIAEIRVAYLKMQQESPTLSDDAIRAKIKENTDHAAFGENNPHIFQRCTDRNTTNDQLDILRYMLYVREQQESGHLSQAQADEIVQSNLLQRFKTNETLEQYKERMAKEKAERAARRKTAK